MNLQQYYQKIRECELAISGEDAWLVSEETGDGGRAGVVNEVPRKVAAKMIVDGIARLATAEEIAEEKVRRERRRPGVAAGLPVRLTTAVAGEAARVKVSNLKSAK
jgi:DNA gyrase/topoisomerase IV subunit A